jgi:hypothetical protein
MSTLASDKDSGLPPWHTFEDILYRLHQEGILLHPHQLAEFFLMHGIPVDLRYVPESLQQRAIALNGSYRGDMARLDEVCTNPWYSYPLT